MKVKYLLLVLILLNVPDPVIYSQINGQNIADPEGLLFSFGVIADIQYADAEKAGGRDYRNSIIKLKQSINELNNHELSFIVSLGDMIDRDYTSFDEPLAILEKSKAPVYNAIGNHDFSVDDQFKGKVRKRLGNEKGYLDFKFDRFTFIVLDGTDVSTFASLPGTLPYITANSRYEELIAEGSNNAYTWNGGIGSDQLEWVEKRLKKADRTGRKVILFCHWPLLPENGTQLWNNKEVLDLIDSHDCVIAWVSGHHHAGGYQKTRKIHHLTIKGLVEAQSDTSCGIIEVYSDKLMLNGYGDQDDRVMEFPK